MVNKSCQVFAKVAGQMDNFDFFFQNYSWSVLQHRDMNMKTFAHKFLERFKFQFTRILCYEKYQKTKASTSNEFLKTQPELFWKIALWVILENWWE